MASGASGEGLECCSDPKIKICESNSGYCSGQGGSCSEGSGSIAKSVLDGCEYTLTVSGQNSSSYDPTPRDCQCKNPDDSNIEEGSPLPVESHPDPCPPPFRIMKNNNNQVKILVNKNFVG